MRRALLTSLALVAALAACSVDVEGARCSVVGATDECPSGQRCGTDLTCSLRAASCTPCTVDDRSCRSDGLAVTRCSAEGDPACGSWKDETSCDALLQACQPQSAGAPLCVCVSWTVEPGGGGACTRPSIASAIAEAVKFPNPTVHLGGAASATYGNELDDAAPIVIPTGLTLIGDDTSSAAGTNRIIAVQGPGPEGLQVHSGAVVRGVAVQRADAGGPTVGVLLAGGPVAAGYTLLSVRVDAGGAGGAFATGLRVAGANAVAVADVLVREASVAGLEVNRLGAADTVQVSQSNFDGNHVGVSLLRGDLTLSGSTVKRSIWEGVVAATGNPGQTSLAMVNDFIAWNGRGGVRLSVNDALVVTSTRICGNTGYDRTLSAVTRTVGGLFAVGNPPPALTFRGNLIHDNGGDQVYVGAAGSTWDLSGAAGCAIADRNVFAKNNAPGVGVGVAAVGATVSARFDYWDSALPVAGTDYFTAAGGVVDAGTGGGTDFCLHDPPAELVCPLP